MLRLLAACLGPWRLDRLDPSGLSHLPAHARLGVLAVHADALTQPHHHLAAVLGHAAAQRRRPCVLVEYGTATV
eukprot:6172485-Pleurochrysis_carterae.AAC.2